MILRGRRAFTLIEIMIAMAMVGTVLTLVYSVFATTSRTIERRELHAGALHRANFILRHLTDHLQSAYLDVAAYYRLEDPSQLFEGGGDALGFWTQSRPQTRREAGSTLQYLAYRVQPADTEDADGGVVLAHVAYPDLSGQGADPVARWEVPVESVTFEYHDGTGWLGGWDVVTEERLPRAIRVTVVMPGGDGDPLELQTVMPLHVTAATETEIADDAIGAGTAAGAEAEDGEVGPDGEPVPATFNPFGSPSATPPARDPIAEALANG